MAVLAKLNAERCCQVARNENMDLSAAADHLVELGWRAYNDHLASQFHASERRDEVIHNKLGVAS